MGARLIFDPACGKLRDPDGPFLKYVKGPRSNSWGELVLKGHLGIEERFCNECDSSVIDTEHMSPDDVARIVRGDPDACLRIRIGQDNVELRVRHG